MSDCLLLQTGYTWCPIGGDNLESKGWARSLPPVGAFYVQGSYVAEEAIRRPVGRSDDPISGLGLRQHA